MVSMLTVVVTFEDVIGTYTYSTIQLIDMNHVLLNNQICVARRHSTLHVYVSSPIVRDMLVNKALYVSF